MLSWHAPEGLGEAHVGSALLAEQPQDGDDESDESEGEEEVSEPDDAMDDAEDEEPILLLPAIAVAEGKRSGGEGGEGGGGEPLPATSSLAPTAEAVAESAAEPAAGGAAGRRGAARLTHAQAAELLERIKEVRKQPTSSSTMVHGWRIEWKMRHASPGGSAGSASTSSRAPQGDLAVYEAGVSGAPYRSLAKLQERLGLVEGKASAAAEAESKAESKAVAKAVAKAKAKA